MFDNRVVVNYILDTREKHNNSVGKCSLKMLIEKEQLTISKVQTQLYIYLKHVYIYLDKTME